MGSWSIERLRREHVRDRFQCGEPTLDEYLAKYARQNDAKGIGRTFVATRPGDLLVLGYYTLRSGAVAAVALPEDERRRLPGYPVPVVHLGRLAVDRSVQGSGLGETLLVDALGRAHVASHDVAAYAVEVVAIGDAARAWYVKYGFREMRDDKLHLYLSMKVLRSLGRFT